MRMPVMAKTWVLAGALLGMAAARAGEVPVPRGAYTLQAEVHGEGGTAIVFESGFGQGPSVWKKVIAGLGADCRCIAYARAGLGTSGTDGKPKTIDEHVADLEAVIDALAPNRKVVLVGHSYGGLLATEYARRHPERLAGLVLVDPATMGQRHAFMRADRPRVQADDASLLKMLPPALAADYRTLIAQLDAPAAATPTAMPDAGRAAHVDQRRRRAVRVRRDSPGQGTVESATRCAVRCVLAWHASLLLNGAQHSSRGARGGGDGYSRRGCSRWRPELIQ